MRNMKRSPLYLALNCLAILLSLAAIPVFAFAAKYAGVYSSEAPAEVKPTGPAGPAFSVSLGSDGTATVTQDPGKSAVTTFGHWKDAEGQITINFDSVDGKPADPPLVLQPSHNGFQAVTWNHDLWGKATPPELKKEKSNWHTGEKRASR